jgi:hypothetical protein
VEESNQSSLNFYLINRHCDSKIVPYFHFVFFSMKIPYLTVVVLVIYSVLCLSLLFLIISHSNNTASARIRHFNRFHPTGERNVLAFNVNPNPRTTFRNFTHIYPMREPVTNQTCPYYNPKTAQSDFLAVDRMVCKT